MTAFRVRRTNAPASAPRDFESADAVRAALAKGELSGADEYFAAGEQWVPLDEHPATSTTDARGIYPAIVHAIVFVKILVYIAFVAALRGTPEDLYGPFAIYVYLVLLGDAVGVLLARANRYDAAVALLSFVGGASLPLGLFLVMAAQMMVNYRVRPPARVPAG